MMILPEILALITWHPRYLPEIKWSSNSWVHNIFRVYELIFWRRYGIRAESATTAWYDEKGKLIVHYKIYSFEAFCAYAETWIRNVPLLKKLAFRIVQIPQFAMPQGGAMLMPYVNFAIAFDAASLGTDETGTATSLTVSHTCTGSDLLLNNGAVTWTGPGDDGDYVTGITYAGATETRLNTVPATGVHRTYLYYKLAPATGANNIVVSVSPAKKIGSMAGSYSGVSQTGFPDASNTGSATAATSLAITVTTVADNCWTVMVAKNNAGNYSAGTGTTIRTAASSLAEGDSNTAITPPGSNTLTFTSASGDHAGCMASFAPPSAAVTTRSPTLLTLGVGT